MTRRPGDEDREAERDYDRMEASEEKRRSRTCVCDTDGTMPGHCPGPDICPYSGSDDQDEDETMTSETENTMPALSERIPSTGEVEAALTLWYEGDPDWAKGLDDDPFVERSRREMSDAIRAAEAVREAEGKV